MDLDSMARMIRSLRRRRNRRRQRRGPHEPRPRRSQEELIEYLLEHDIHSSRALMRKRQRHEPTIYDFRKSFGSWSAAMAAAHGSRRDPFKPSVDPEYLIHAVIELDLWSYRRFLAARKRRPDLVPSINQIRRHCGTFSNLLVVAERHSTTRTLRKYAALHQRLGRRPTLLDCQRAGISLDALQDFLPGTPGKWGVDRFVAEGLRAVASRAPV